MTPTSRTLKHLRDKGYTAAIVEKWNPFVGPRDKQCRECGKNKVGIRQDLFGVIDVVALGGGFGGVLGVQTCAGSGHSSRYQKIVASAEAKRWVECGNRLWIISWAIKGAAGTRKKYQPRIQELTIGDFPEEKIEPLNDEPPVGDLFDSQDSPLHMPSRDEEITS